MQLTEQQVMAMAPDAQVASSGKKLGGANSWSNMGNSPRAVWGECKGSGSKPYQVRVDCSDYAAKCSCPSHKFPCKHAIGLLLLVSSQPALARADNEPQWVSEWLDKRADAQEQKQKRAQVSAEVDPVAQQKRQERRDNRLDEGLTALERWLSDLIRRGLAQIAAEGPSLWEKQAARMVDAQAPGIASRLRQLGEIVGVHDTWPARVFDGLGQISLLIQAWRRKERLSPELRRELELQMGQTVRESDVIAQSSPVQDQWQVIAQEIEELERLRVRRTWLLGKQSKRYALLLHAAVNKQAFIENVPPGTAFQASLHFWPGAYPLRATTNGSLEAQPLPTAYWHAESIHEFLERQANALASNPWLQRLPVVLEGVIPARTEDGWWAMDAQGNSLPLHTGKSARIWGWMACCGGNPDRIAGEWQEGAFVPQALYLGDRYIALGD